MRIRGKTVKVSRVFAAAVREIDFEQQANDEQFWGRIELCGKVPDSAAMNNGIVRRKKCVPAFSLGSLSRSLYYIKQPRSEFSAVALFIYEVKNSKASP